MIERHISLEDSNRWDIFRRKRIQIIDLYVKLKKDKFKINQIIRLFNV